MTRLRDIDTRHPDWLPLAILLLLAIGFFFPVLFMGKAPAMNSLRNVEPWRSAWVARGDAIVKLLPGQGPLYSYNSPEGFADDLNRQFIPWGTYAQERLRSGEWPLWNPHVASGQPLYANHQTGLTNPLILLCYYLFSGINAFTAIFLSVFILMGWGMYSYMRILGLDRWPSLLTAASYQFMLGYIPTLDTLVVEKALFPILLYSVERIFRSPGGKGGIWVFLSILLLALVQTSAHAQEAVFISYILGPYIVFIAGGADSFPSGRIWRNIFKRLLIAAGIFIPALALGFVQNFPTSEFYRLSTRPEGFQEEIQAATSLENNLSWIQSLMIAFPRLFGDYIRPVQYLEHYLLNYGYVGIVTLLASMFAGWIRPNKRQVWFWRIIALVFFVSIISNWFYFNVLCQLPLFRISLQKPFTPLFFALIVLGGHGLAAMLTPHPKGSRESRVMGRTSLFVFGSAISLTAVVVSLLAIPRDPDITYRIYVASQILIGTCVASAACLVISLLWRYVNEKQLDLHATRKSVSIAAIALLVIVLLDLWPIKAHFNPMVKKDDLYFPTKVTDFLTSGLKWEPGNPDGPYRFARSWKEILPPNTGMMFDLDDIGGYDSNLVGRYGELMRAIDPTLMEEIHYIEAPHNREKFGLKAWNMLGVKYVLAHPGHTGQFKPVSQWVNDYIGDILIVRNTDALPRMNAVENVYQIFDDPEALKKTIDINPAFEAVVSREGSLPNGMPPARPVAESAILESPGTVAISDYQPERVLADVKLARPSLVCFYDTWFPGWKVTIDDQPADLERVDYTFKGVFVPEGNHQVVFTYKPDSLRFGLIGSLIGLVLAMVLSKPIGKLAG